MDGHPQIFKGASFVNSVTKRELGDGMFKLKLYQNKLFACHLSEIGEKHFVLAVSADCKHKQN